jgi:hypothetical protein
MFSPAGTGIVAGGKEIFVNGPPGAAGAGTLGVGAEVDRRGKISAEVRHGRAQFGGAFGNLNSGRNLSLWAILAGDGRQWGG